MEEKKRGGQNDTHHLAVAVKSSGTILGVGEFTTHFRAYLSGDWDVHCDYRPTAIYLRVHAQCVFAGERQEAGTRNLSALAVSPLVFVKHACTACPRQFSAQPPTEAEPSGFSQEKFRNMIADEYLVNWMVDNLPAATRYRQTGSLVQKLCRLRRAFDCFLHWNPRIKGQQTRFPKSKAIM